MASIPIYKKQSLEKSTVQAENTEQGLRKSRESKNPVCLKIRVGYI